MKKQRKKRKDPRRRPSPPPPPPDSLVQLIQTDSSVFKYFKSLQANLEADVQVWKDRAARLKQEKNELLKSEKKSPNQKTHVNRKANQKRAAPSETDTDSNGILAQAKRTTSKRATSSRSQQTQGAPVPGKNDTYDSGDSTRQVKRVKSSSKSAASHQGSARALPSKMITTEANHPNPNQVTSPSRTEANDQNSAQKRSTHSIAAVANHRPNQYHDAVPKKTRTVGDPVRAEPTQSKGTDAPLPQSIQTGATLTHTNHSSNPAEAKPPSSREALQIKPNEAAEEGMEIDDSMFEIASSSSDEPPENTNVPLFDVLDLDSSSSSSSEEEPPKTQIFGLAAIHQESSQDEEEKLGELRGESDKPSKSPGAVAEGEKNEENQEVGQKLGAEMRQVSHREPPKTHIFGPVASSHKDTQKVPVDEERKIHEKQRVRTESQDNAQQEKCETLQLLHVAYISFQKLGIRLVDIVEEEEVADGPGADGKNGDESSNLITSLDEQSDSREDAAAKVVRSETVTRRSDQEVASDTMAAVKDLTRLYTQYDDEDFLPFDKTTLIPCSSFVEESFDDDNVHPAVEGKRLLVRALIMVDTMCSPFISIEDWSSLFDQVAVQIEEQQLREMKIGLQSRKAVVDNLVETLHQNVSTTWATTDRTDRHRTATMFFDKENGSDEDMSRKGIVGGPRSLSRLATIAERCIFAEVVICLYLARDDTERACHLVMAYVVSTAPVPKLEDYPRLYPVMSALVLESLLLPDTKNFWWKDRNDDRQESWITPVVASKPFLVALSLTMHAVAAIYKERISSSDDRIHDIALVELESCRRVCRRLAMGFSKYSIDIVEAEAALQCKDLYEQLLYQDRGDESPEKTWALKLALLLSCDKTFVRSLLLRLFGEVTSPQTPKVAGSCRLLSVCQVMSQMLIREVSTLGDAVGTQTSNYVTPDFSDCYELLRKPTADQALTFEHRAGQLLTVIESTSSLGDGASTLELVKELIVEFNRLENISAIPRDSTKRIIDSIRTLAENPVVRVINLKRRKDRMNSFMAQALQAGLLVLYALGNMAEGNAYNATTTEDDLDFGGYAVDGGGRMAVAQEHLVQVAGSLAVLNKLVAPDWRPSDLKPFDRDAPDHEDLVLATASERACALSHISSWKGAHRSMRLQQPLDYNGSDRSMFRHPANLVRLFKISGFAEGRALLLKNESMLPVPVCVILEDDAILVNGFVDQLKALLKELPRDFHWCAIGYGRPKSAPIVPYTRLVGIPTMLWYLTGYIVSEQGVQHLLESLPVVGPVDSWIGLKMTKNWENTYGANLGVGIHAKPKSELPARKDLTHILKFRAFCSLRPLCSQRMGTVAAGGRGWRQRDTDIDYSGNNMGLVKV